MRGMLKIVSAGVILCAGVLVWADGAAGASKGAKSAPSVRLPGPAFVALESITPEHIRWHVRYLSHDLLEGRGTGQRGGDIAAEYMATQFAEYGLKPAGDHGTYMQKVPLVGITTLPETQFSLVPKQGEAMNLKPLDEYVAYDTRSRRSRMWMRTLFLWDMGLMLRSTTGTTTKGWTCAGKFC